MDIHAYIDGSLDLSGGAGGVLAFANDLVPLRPDRSEPRAVKRRPKVYQLLTKPRLNMVVSSSRDLKSADNTH